MSQEELVEVISEDESQPGPSSKRQKVGAPRTARSKGWTGAQYQRIAGWYERFTALTNGQHRSTIRFLVAQDEICPSTGKHHVQWCIGTTTPRAYTTIMQWLWHDAPGDHELIADEHGCWAYCQKEINAKDGTPARMPGGQTFVFGEQPAKGVRGARTDLVQLNEAINARVSRGDFSTDWLFNEPETQDAAYRLQTGIKAKYASLKKKAVKRKVKVCFCYGLAGSGKTECTHGGLEGQEYWSGDMENGFFAEIAGMKVGVMDEFSGEGMAPETFLKILDGQAFTANIKNSSVAMELEDIRISGNRYPSEYWWAGKKTRPDQGAVYRRLPIVHYHYTVYDPERPQYWRVVFTHSPIECTKGDAAVYACNKMEMMVAILSLQSREVKADPTEWLILQAYQVENVTQRSEEDD